MRSLKRITVHSVLLATIALTAAWAPRAWAAATAFDAACNDSGINGTNGGTGFGTWSTTIAVSGGTYTATDNAISNGTCATAWGNFTGTNTTTSTSQARPFTTANGTNILQAGQQVSAMMHNGGIATGGSEGMSLWNASGNAVLELIFNGGSSSWSINDSSGIHAASPSIPYAGSSVSGLVAVAKLTSSTTYSLTVTEPANRASGTQTVYGPYTGTLANPSGGQGITQLRFYTHDDGSGNNLQFNNIGVGCPDTLSFTTQPASEAVPTNDTALFSADAFGDSVTYQWQSSPDGSSWSSIASGTNGYSITATNYESYYSLAASSSSDYRVIATDACGNTATSSVATLTLAATIVDSITTQPANTTVCSNSPATFTVTASGSSPGYDWLQQSNAGWGAGNAWSVIASNAGSGVFLGNSTNNDSTGFCTGFGNDDINSPITGNALGMFGPVIKVLRVFPSALSVGQWFSIDMDSGNTDTGIQNGFSLHTGLPNTNAVLFSFYFLGGQRNYKIFDATGEHDTGIRFTHTGVRVQILTGTAVGGTNTYSLSVMTNQCGASSEITNVFSGSFETNGLPGSVLLYNNNNEGGTANDLYFNNLVAGGTYDNADNYSVGNWANGGNGGDLPIAGATNSSYTINNAQSSGTYYVIVTNTVGAVISSTATVAINPTPSCLVSPSSAAICAGSSQTFMVTPSGGTPGYTYLWSNGSTGTSITTNATGTYSVTVTDSNGCTTTCSATLTVNPAPTFTYSSQNNTQCGGTNGSITVSASGGSGTYTYSDNNGSTYQSSDVFTGLVSGAYEVVVKDSNGCVSGPTLVTISDPNGPSFTFTQVNETCNGQSIGSITVTASGGNGSYAYSDNNGISYQSGNQFTGLSAGTYTVVVKDGNGCKSGGQIVTITQPSAVTFTTSQTNETCNAQSVGSITVTASGGSGAYQYSDNNGSTYQSGNTFGGLSAATYQIVVEDGNGCLSATTPVTITQPAVLSCSVSPSVVTNCAGSPQIFAVNVSGGTPAYTYSWSGPNSFSATGSSVTNNDVQPANAGTYTVTVTDANGCQSICTATLTVNVAPSISIGPTNTAVCSGSSTSLTITASGTSLQYFWRQRGSGWGTNDGWMINTSSGDISQDGTFIGDSSLNSGGSGTHSNINSSAGTAFGLYANSGASVDAYRGFGSLAVGQTIQVDIENGYISSGGPSVGFGIQNSVGTNLWEFYFAGGNQGYTLHDAAGTTTNTLAFTANGLRISFTLTSSNTYSATVVTPNRGGSTYTFTGTLITPFSGIQVPAQLHFWNLDAGDGCSGSGCTPYDFFFNNLYVAGVPDTASVALYSDDAANYTNSSSWTGGSNLGQGPIANVLPNSSEFSGANTATLTINPSTSIDASNYDVVVTNSCGAARSNPALLTVNTLPNIYNVTGGGAYCSGGSGASVTLSNSDIGVNYQLELNSSPTGSPAAGIGSGLTFSNQTAAGTYTIVANNTTTGCASTMSGNATVTINPTPSCSITPSNAVICAGNSQTFTVTPAGGAPGYTYLWSDGSTGTSITTNAAGTYSVTVTDSNGCTTSCSATLAVNPTPSCTVSPASATICAGGSQIFTVNPSGGTPGYTYLWSTGATTSNISASTTGTYSVTVTDANDCTTTCSAMLTVNPLPSTPTASNNGPICAGGTLTLSTPTVAGAMYSWTGPSSFTSAAQNPSIVGATTTASGTYLVTITDSNGCVSAAASTTATVNPTPAAPTAGNNGPIIEGNTLNLTASTVAGVTYGWTGPNSFASTNQNPSISNTTSAASGVYSVTVTDSNGCTATSSTTALVTALKITSITLQGGSNIQITWATTGGTTDELQEVQGTPGYTTNFIDFAGPFVISGSGDTSTNYIDVGAATNSPAKFYRVRLVP